MLKNRDTLALVLPRVSTSAFGGRVPGETGFWPAQCCSSSDLASQQVQMRTGCPGKGMRMGMCLEAQLVLHISFLSVG